MEEGSLRCDANVSVRLKGAERFGTKVEVKNVNSFRFVRAALGVRDRAPDRAPRIRRARHAGEPAVESDEGRTYSMRSKEQAHDYRYFPEPDLPASDRLRGVFGRNEKEAAGTARGSPRPHDRRIRAEPAGRLHADRNPRVRRPLLRRRQSRRNPRRVANVLLSEVGGRLKALGLEQEHSPVSMAGIVQAADLLDEGKIQLQNSSSTIDLCFEKGEDFPAVYEREKPQQISDASRLKP